jgi:insulysin
LVWPWEEGQKDGGGEKEMRDILNGFRIGIGRAVLMARAEEHEDVNGNGEWQQEPCYGTKYRVSRFEDEFIKEVSSTFSPFVIAGGLMRRWSTG